MIAQELKELREMVAVLQPPKPTRRPILIDEACKILGKAKPTVYTLSRLGEIPSCRQGRKVYFYEDELLEYINSGKVLQPGKYGKPQSRRYTKALDADK